MISIRFPKIMRNKKALICVIVLMLIIGVVLLLYKHKDDIKQHLSVSLSMEEEPVALETYISNDDTELIATSQIFEMATEAIDQEEELVLETAEESEVDALYPVEIADTYVQKGEMVEFVSFHPEAMEYIWEMYDMAQKDWVIADLGNVFLEKDELHREVSVFRMQVMETHNDSIVRCTVKLKDGSDKKDTASLYVLQEKIKDISIDDAEILKCGYISALEVPVKVTYDNDQSEIITGLYGLKFLCSQKTTEYEESVSGNFIERRIETVTECDYTYLQSGVNEKKLRYVNLRENECSVRITGCDKEAPVISEVIIGDYIVTKERKDEPVRVEIYAEDNDTPYPKLKYAFAHEDTDIKEVVFGQKNEWDVDIDKNGIWIAYVSDESGNIAEYSQKIIMVDELPPKLTLSLKEASWCRENEIIADGKDGTKLMFQVMRENECVCDWTSKCSFPVTENGTYIVKAKDEAGNETLQEITVENIDKQAPVITNIREGGYNRNEK